MKCEVNKIAGKLAESEVALRAVEPRVLKDPASGVPLKLHPLNRNKCIEAKIADLNKKIRRAKKNRVKSALITKRDKLKAELDSESSLGFVQLQSAFNNAYRCYRLSGYQGIDPGTFFAKMRKMLVDLIKCETISEAVRTQATTRIKFRKGNETIDLAFNSRMLAAYGLNDIDELVNRMLAHMLEQIKNPALRDSGFALEEVIETNIDFHRFNLIRGSSYLPLPSWLSVKKAIINPKNDDMECFKWAVIAADRWEEIDKHPERVSKLKRFKGEYDWPDIEFLFTTRRIDGFEKKNKISVNLLALKGDRVYIRRKSTRNHKRVINLMLITGKDSFPDDKSRHNRKHYITVKSLRRLLMMKNSKHDKAQHHCMNCLHGLSTEISRNKHESYCVANDAVRIEIPTKKPYVRYSEGQYNLMFRS